MHGMGHAWYMHGICMVWDMHGICMVYAWYGTCMVYAWYGTCSDTRIHTLYTLTKARGHARAWHGQGYDILGSAWAMGSEHPLHMYQTPTCCKGMHMASAWHWMV
jgi:hypothetical protein